ncbi:hypothetical protein WA026_005574 [Henosepilachna vigintioctopunctata]|uniref:Serpin domain-containing protein n=1 Tax=Henosepilachna vigintioctopunctata TaxID=420089 RepID=A0AAW1TTB5_9CUCU
MWKKLFGIITLTSSIVFAEEALQELEQGDIDFSALLYQQIGLSTVGNIILSPFSVLVVLGLTLFGAKGDTAVELSQGLHLPNSQEKIKDAFKSLLPKLKGNQYFSLSSANKIYIKNGYTINPDFLKLAEDVFETDLESINFSDTSKAANTINKWVESKTNGKIKNFIEASALDPLTRLMLINAIYFKGNWTSQFPSQATRKRKFYKYGKQEIEVDTMFQSSNFKFSDNKELDAKFLQIPYKGSDIIFTIAVPNQQNGLGALEQKLPQVLRQQNYSTTKVNLYLPKFRINSSFKLIPALEKLGIKKVFSREADLSGLLTNKEPLTVSTVLQKAFINVTESGTEAAAVTGVGVAPTSIIIPDNGVNLRVDRPFFYSISYKNFPIFVGRVVSPEI